MTTLGDMLIEARKKSGLSAHDVSQRSHIMLSSIYSLEDNNHSSLPAAGYVRGYILSYCKLCDVDPTPYLEQYERQSGNSRRDSIGKPSYSYSTDAAARKMEHEINWRFVAAAAALVVVIVAMLVFINQCSGNNELELNPLPAAAEATVTAEDSNSASEEDAEPFSFVIAPREGRASDVHITVDGNIAFDGALTNERSFDGVSEAEIRIANPENIILQRGEDNIVIPGDGELVLR